MKHETAGGGPTPEPALLARYRAQWDHAAQYHAECIAKAQAEIGGLAVGVLAYREAHPQLVCTRCKGAGCYMDGPRWVGTCEPCKGLGRIDMTIEQCREAYGNLRSLAGERIGMTARDFDALVSSWLPDDPQPGNWVTTARQVLRRTGMR